MQLFFVFLLSALVSCSPKNPNLDPQTPFKNPASDIQFQILDLTDSSRLSTLPLGDLIKGISYSQSFKISNNDNNPLPVTTAFSPQPGVSLTHNCNRELKPKAECFVSLLFNSDQMRLGNFNLELSINQSQYLISGMVTNRVSAQEIFINDLKISKSNINLPAFSGTTLEDFLVLTNAGSKAITLNASLNNNAFKIKNFCPEALPVKRACIIKFFYNSSAAPGSSLNSVLTLKLGSLTKEIPIAGSISTPSTPEYANKVIPQDQVVDLGAAPLNSEPKQANLILINLTNSNLAVPPLPDFSPFNLVSTNCGTQLRANRICYAQLSLNTQVLGVQEKTVFINGVSVLIKGVVHEDVSHLYSYYSLMISEPNPVHYQQKLWVVKLEPYFMSFSINHLDNPTLLSSGKANSQISFKKPLKATINQSFYNLRPGTNTFTKEFLDSTCDNGRDNLANELPAVMKFKRSPSGNLQILKMDDSVVLELKPTTKETLETLYAEAEIKFAPCP